MGTNLSPPIVRSDSVPATAWLKGVVAILVLTIGACVYVLDRPAESAPFFTAISLDGLVPNMFGRVGDHLPTFSHVFAFSLLTAACLGGGRRAGLWACLTWFGIDVTFEVGQHPEIAEHMVRIIPDWFESMPILKHAKGYFLSGTFDVWDVLSIVVGAIAAFILTAVIQHRTIHHG